MPEEATTTTTAEAADAAVAALESVAADQKVADLEALLRDANERALRTQAELENYRKRSQRELADERRYAVVPLVRDLLPVVDNLERAIEAANMQIQKVSEGNSGSTATDL